MSEEYLRLLDIFDAHFSRNPSYPSTFTTPTSATDCAYTINKINDNICQLRLDFQTFSGFATSTTAGSCYDTLAMAGQTGVDPPSICGTNTGFHSKSLAVEEEIFVIGLFL